MTVAENIAFLVRDHLRCSSPEYLQRKATGDLAGVQAKFDTPVLILGDFNDEPSDASVVGHLQASSELDRVVGATNQITKFETEVATYRGDDTRLYNACWKFLAPENQGTFFIESTASGEHFANRYQVLDNLVASRGLLLQGGITLDPATVDIYRAASVATPTGRPPPIQQEDQERHLRPPPHHRRTDLLAQALLVAATRARSKSRPGRAAQIRSHSSRAPRRETEPIAPRHLPPWRPPRCRPRPADHCGLAAPRPPDRDRPRPGRCPLINVSHARGLSPDRGGARVSQVISSMRVSRGGGAPVTTMDKGTRVSLPGQAMLDMPARGSRVDESCGD